MTYTHLSQTERYQIQALMKAGQTQIEIARVLVRHKSTISRELARGVRVLAGLEDAMYELGMTDAPRTRGRKPKGYVPSL